jgi:DUF971 family protein
MATPVEIKLNRAERNLFVRFDDGGEFTYSAEYLRVESPSAEVQGHRPSDRVFIGGKSRVGITTIEPVGNYAIKIEFDDGHDTGIFSWDVLQTLAIEHDTRWSVYLDRLQSRGLSR